MKKRNRIIARILAVPVLLLLAGLVFIQSPRVQTAAGRWAMGKLQDRLDADISFRMVSLRPFDALVLQDFLVRDRAPHMEGMDTVLYVRSLYASFSLKGLLSHSAVRVHSLLLDGGAVNVGMEKDTLAPSGSFTNIQRILGLSYPQGDSEMHWGDLLHAREVEIRNLAVRYASQTGAERMLLEGRSVYPGVMDWNNLHILVDQLKVRNVRLADDLIVATVERLSARDTDTGLHIQEASAKEVRVGKERMRIEDLLLQETESYFDLSLLQLSGSLDDYGDFEQKIDMDIRVRPATTVAMHTVSHFSRGLDRNRFRGRLKGRVKGPVAGMTLENVAIQDLDNGVVVQTSGTITGLPEVPDTRLDLNVRELGFDMAGLGGFVNAWAPDTRLDLRSLARGERFHFDGKLGGLLDRLQVLGQVQSRLGGVSADVLVHNAVSDGQPIRLSGALQTRELHLGKLLGNNSLGALDMQTGLEASFPDNEGLQVRIDSLHISRLHALDYDYSDISAVGTYREDSFDGRIIAADPNLNFLFQGLFNLSPRTRNATYRFFASLGYADLHALHLDPREQSKLSFLASSNFIRTERRDLLGEIRIGDLVLESETGVHELGDVAVRAHANDNLHRIRLQSSFMQASFLGDHSIGDFINDLKDLIIQRDLPALLENAPEPWQGGSYDLSFQFKDVQDLLAFLVPGAYVQSGTKGQVKIDKEGVVKASLESGRVALQDKYIKDFRFTFDNEGVSQQAEITGSTLSLSGARILGNHLILFADNNHVGLGYTFDNGEEEETRAQLYLTGELSRDDGGLAVTAQAQPSNLYYKGNGWGLSSGDITYRGGRISINRLLAQHEDETLLVHGGYAPEGTDTLRFLMDRFDIGLMNTLSGDLPSLEGKATGQAVIVSPASPMPGILASITCDSTRVAGERLGKVELSSQWDEPNKRFNAYLRNQLDGRRTLDVEGWLNPSQNLLHAAANMDGMNLGYAAPYLTSVFSTFGGGLSGTVTVDGPLDRLQLASRDLRMQDALLTIDYTQSTYKANGPLELNSRGLFFRDVQLSDGEGGSGVLGGSVLFDNLKDLALSLDTHIRVQDLQVLNLPRGANPTLFGKLYATGQADITGPLKRILLDINASTARTGELHIPLSSGRSDSSRELLTFTQPVIKEETDPYELMMAGTKKAQESSSNLDVRLRVRATPEIRAYIDVDDETSLNASGSGNIELETSSAKGDFSMGGQYDISEGSFHFSALNLVSRDFTIQEGSSIRFNGDIDNTDLNVNGLYVTKASLANLIADENAVNRRTVNCGIHITGKLLNPEVDFSIEVPDLNPGTQAMVEGALNTDDKIQKQFIYLLIAGNFLPSEESGITQGGSDVLFSNVSSIMSGQLNNIFQKLDIPLDLGLNYQATQTGNNIFDVALSTQLFHNRVIVNGSVGNKQQYGSATANEMAGDIDIEIKLNRSGSQRLNLFSHSADDLTSSLDNSQRNGGGFTYQREFNSFRQFLRELFQPRSERQDADRSSLSAGRTTTLQIDSTGKATPVHDN